MPTDITCRQKNFMHSLNYYTEVIIENVAVYGILRYSD